MVKKLKFATMINVYDDKISRVSPVNHYARHGDVFCVLDWDKTNDKITVMDYSLDNLENILKIYERQGKRIEFVYISGDSVVYL